VNERKGVDLILPVASMLPLERLASWLEKAMIPAKVLSTMADGAAAIAPVLTAGKAFDVAQIVAKLGKVGPLVAKAGPMAAKLGPLAAKANMGAAAIPALIVAVKMAEPRLKELNEQAKESHDCLTATLTQFKLDLDQGEKDGVLFKGK